jgi:HK97 family phage portal protein
MASPFGGLARVMNRATTPERYTAADRYWIPSRDHTAGIVMNADEAIRLSAVWACVTVIAKAIASSEWDVFEEDRAGNRTAMKDTAVWRMLNLRPNGEMIPFAFREAMLIIALVDGNAYAEIERDIVGRAVALWPLAPERCCLERDERGALVLRVNNSTGDQVYLDYSDVFHLHGPSLDGVAGFDTVKLAARTLAHAAAAERFGSAFYGNGTSFGGILKTDLKVGSEAIDDLRSAVEKRGQGPMKAWNFMVLGGGMEYQKLTVDPEQAQFIETRFLMIEEVCRFFGVPPHKIAHLLRATFSNIEHQGLEFVRDALTPWCERLRQEADFKLVPGSGRFLRTRLDIDWLGEGDAKSRAETDGLLVTNGIMLRNEARRKRGWNSIGPEGDKATVNPGTTALKQALEPPKPAPIAPAPDPAAPPPPKTNGATAHA